MTPRSTKSIVRLVDMHDKALDEVEFDEAVISDEKQSLNQDDETSEVSLEDDVIATERFEDEDMAQIDAHIDKLKHEEKKVKRNACLKYFIILSFFMLLIFVTTLFFEDLINGFVFLMHSGTIYPPMPSTSNLPHNTTNHNTTTQSP